MKKINTLLCMGLLCLSMTAMANGPHSAKEDTVIIEFGKNSRVVIITQTAEDMRKLATLDINQMISDLNSSLDSGQVALEIIIEDSTGAVYQRDTVERQEGGLVYYGESSTTDSNWKESEWEDPDEESEKEISWEDFWDSDDDEYKRTRGAFEIEIGMNNWLEKGKFPDANGELYSIKPWGSWYFGLGHTNRTHVTGPLLINWGAGVSWYTWKLENTNVRIIKDPDATVFVEDPNVNGTKSKLSATFINATLVPMLDFGYSKEENQYGSFRKYSQKGFRIGLGGYMGYRIDSWTKFVYKDNGDKQKDKTKSNYFMNGFRYGVRGQMGFRGMDMFVNYDLNNVFAEDRGPELNGLSFGIIL
ncbi:hypothetical protein BFP72_03560 [Reichenbachiella sp. 5M10]|uniref:hypothetical protein n=1 Tax=Reichenbachiella sp. 5M10 TaxID=1889772 RepID=UPI000C153D78|nr:hypothetical protein [Reichenbachiella sp. 5M10]PIB34550.1 hypothetical protein BFP72_03560 [Reichenbachiella sp. 5M10]